MAVSEKKLFPVTSFLPLRLVEWHFAPGLSFVVTAFPPSGPHMAHLLLAEWLSRLTFEMELLCS